MQKGDPMKPRLRILLMTGAALVLAAFLVLSQAGGRLSSYADYPGLPERQEAEPIRATIGSMGDLLIHETLLKAAARPDGSYDFSPIFQHLTPYIQNLDLAVINYEGTVGAAAPYTGYPMFRSPASLAAATRAAGFDLSLTANNHLNDGGSQGISRTLETLRNAGLLTLGTRLSADEPSWQLADLKGIKVGISSWTYGEWRSDGRRAVNGLPISQEQTPLSNVFSYDQLEAYYALQEGEIRAMKEAGAEFIIAYLHWGAEYKLQANEWQKQIAARLAAMGGDALIGGHPHVIQPLEVVTAPDGHQMVCLYSMGNAVSDQRAAYGSHPSGHTEDGLLYTLTLLRDPAGKVSLESISYLPTWVNKTTLEGRRAFQIIPLDESRSWQGLFQTSGEESQARSSLARTRAQLEEGFQAFRESYGR